jgi:hypothetical protein
LGSIKQKLQKGFENWQKSQQEKRKLDTEIKQKERAAFNEAYAKSRVETARQRGREKGKQRGGVGGTLAKIGRGFEGTYREMYPEYAKNRTRHRASGHRARGTTIRVDGTTIHVQRKSTAKHRAKSKKPRSILDDILGW